ncbi:hypothetical protein [Ornithinicoccus halotolerans]|uniref:hypothetical protein n=1 Tax=Ornithinicoccus halotolerans TaxID=1748220 RepID=UPI001885CDD4|nr:hypothetical protein [Ornithinicoccus halotolerans]
MAEFLIRQWRLAVLRVQLDLSAHEPVIRVTLVDMPDGTPARRWERRYATTDFGIPRRGDPDRLVLPPDLVTDVGTVFREELPEETALWLRLVPPYGYLGGAPWEEDLVPVLGRPVLRVPDRLPVAIDFGSAWTAAIAVNADPTTDWAGPYLYSLLGRLRERVDGELSVHVFADAATTARLQQLCAPEASAGASASPPPLAVTPGSWWHLHDPRGARRRATPTPWSDWVRSGLSGCAVRSLHVVTDATLDGDEPMLLVAQDPEDPTENPNLVPVDAVLRLTDSIGAATLSFGSPPDNASDLATRMLADEVGRVRSGPTLYSCLEEDPEGWALAGAHAYLADPQGDEALPWDRSLFCYVQPEHVRHSLLQGWPEASPPLTPLPDGELLPTMPTGPALPPDTVTWPGASRLHPAPEAPAWVAASHRYLDDRWSTVARTARAVAADDRTDLRDAYDQGATAALRELRDVIDRHGGPR